MIRFFLCALLIFNFSYTALSQNLTGTWSGSMEGHERIHVYIEMKRNELCGYTWDYAMNDPNSYCKAVFKGWYDEDSRMWMLRGTHFMENSGSHILMLLRLRLKSSDPDAMSGTVETAGRASLLGIGRGKIQLRRVSEKLPDDMPDCFPKITKPESPEIKKEAVIKPLPKNVNPHGTNKPSVTKPVVKSSVPPAKRASGSKAPVAKTPQTKKPPVATKKPAAKKPFVRKPTADSSVKRQPGPVTYGKDVKAPEALLKKLNARKNNEFSRLVVHDRTIFLKVYDNGIVDNDTVSIFYNGRLLAGKKGLSENPLEITLELDEDTDIHELTMFAENLGSISPNTALIVVTTTDKRHELHSSASLTENAVLSFEYRPR